MTVEDDFEDVVKAFEKCIDKMKELNDGEESISTKQLAIILDLYLANPGTDPALVIKSVRELKRRVQQGQE